MALIVPVFEVRLIVQAQWVKSSASLAHGVEPGKRLTSYDYNRSLSRKIERLPCTQTRRLKSLAQALNWQPLREIETTAIARISIAILKLDPFARPSQLFRFGATI
jgi:hypothetical protein